MESMVKKYQQRFRKVKDEMDKWDSLDSSFLSQFRNASSIINRLQVIRDSKNYGTLSGVDGIVHMVLRKQMDSLQNILISMYKSLDEFRAIVLFLERIQRDGRHLFSGGSSRLTTKQLQQRVGIKPCLIDCMDGLTILHDMHHSEYLFKKSMVLALPSVIFQPCSGDLAAFQQLLVDQPNILKEEVKFIFDVIFAEEIC
ncbi:Pentatricopeptide repeat (PPR) superfamily protein [Euphorbia peplus]|nr:Pentatricopeptide repeat (PPR) superfamily protein [Euphorbia peplus]